MCRGGRGTPPPAPGGRGGRASVSMLSSGSTGTRCTSLPMTISGTGTVANAPASRSLTSCHMAADAAAAPARVVEHAVPLGHLHMDARRGDCRSEAVRSAARCRGWRCCCGPDDQAVGGRPASGDRARCRARRPPVGRPARSADRGSRPSPRGIEKCGVRKVHSASSRPTPLSARSTCRSRSRYPTPNRSRGRLPLT